MTAPSPVDKANNQMRPLPRWIFASRWLQAPLYVGLIVAQAIYVLQFWRELVHLIELIGIRNIAEAEIMLIVLGLIDVVMISNLLVMVIVGGWETFVSRMDLEHHPDQPEWLSHVNAGVLKIKLAMAIVGISSIHLLRTFIEARSLGLGEGHGHGHDKIMVEGVMWQTIIHVIFIASAIGIAAVERMAEVKHEPAPTKH